MKTLIVIFSIGILSFSCGVSPSLLIDRPTSWSQKIENSEFNNLFSVDKDLFRSEQPSSSGMKELEKLGIKTILNVRNLLNDKSEGKNTNLKLIKYRINTWTITYEEVVSALKIIKESPKPMLIHCKHGSDRTGCIVAAYRMGFMNWDKEEAIREFKNGGYGYHDKAFPNVLALLENINVIQLKKDVLL